MAASPLKDLISGSFYLISPPEKDKKYSRGRFTDLWSFYSLLPSQTNRSFSVDPQVLAGYPKFVLPFNDIFLQLSSQKQ
jgi:hypothetical protein